MDKSEDERGNHKKTNPCNTKYISVLLQPSMQNLSAARHLAYNQETYRRSVRVAKFCKGYANTEQ